MRELALHILDVAENSIEAGADNLWIKVEEYCKLNQLYITITDDGPGINQESLINITDPFITSRSLRPVGLGLSLFKAAAERCEGHLKINSSQEGTKVKAVFKYNHIDRAPLGNIAQTIVSILLRADKLDLNYRHIYEQECFVFDSKKIKDELKGVSLKNGKIISWLKKYIEDNVKALHGGGFS